MSIYDIYAPTSQNFQECQDLSFYVDWKGNQPREVDVLDELVIWKCVSTYFCRNIRNHPAFPPQLSPQLYFMYGRWT